MSTFDIMPVYSTCQQCIASHTTFQSFFQSPYIYNINITHPIPILLSLPLFIHLDHLSTAGTTQYIDAILPNLHFWLSSSTPSQFPNVTLQGRRIAASIGVWKALCRSGICFCGQNWHLVGGPHSRWNLLRELMRPNRAANLMVPPLAQHTPTGIGLM